MSFDDALSIVDQMIQTQENFRRRAWPKDLSMSSTNLDRYMKKKFESIDS